MRRALPVLAAVATVGAALAFGLYAGRVTSPATAEVVTQPATSSASARPAETGSPAQNPEMHACVLGFGLALDAGISWDTNTALEDAYALKVVADRLPAGQIRSAAQAVAKQLPDLASRDVNWDDPIAAERDDPSAEIALLLAKLHDACDVRFGEAAEIAAGAANLV